MAIRRAHIERISVFKFQFNFKESGKGFIITNIFGWLYGSRPEPELIKMCLKIPVHKLGGLVDNDYMSQLATDFFNQSINTDRAFAETFKRFI